MSDDKKTIAEITADSAGWKYCGLKVRYFRAGQDLSFCEGNIEACLVVLSGTFDVEVSSNGKKYSFKNVGKRADVFSGLPEAVYAGCSNQIKATCVGSGELAIASSLLEQNLEDSFEPRILNRIRSIERGTGNHKREIRDILMESEHANKLLITEVITPAGNWSSYPPHKHDTHNPPHETQLEEIYFFKLKNKYAWAIQRIYDKSRSLDQISIVKDNEVNLVKRGYHPVVAVPNSDLYYLNVMAGPIRKWCITYDEDFVKVVDL
jgi:5-deoxy-glucuronate isomerase